MWNALTKATYSLSSRKLSIRDLREFVDALLDKSKIAENTVKSVFFAWCISSRLLWEDDTQKLPREATKIVNPRISKNNKIPTSFQLTRKSSYQTYFTVPNHWNVFWVCFQFNTLKLTFLLKLGQLALAHWWKAKDKFFMRQRLSQCLVFAYSPVSVIGLKLYWVGH